MGRDGIEKAVPCSTLGQRQTDIMGNCFFTPQSYAYRRRRVALPRPELTVCSSHCHEEEPTVRSEIYVPLSFENNGRGDIYYRTPCIPSQRNRLFKALHCFGTNNNSVTLVSVKTPISHHYYLPGHDLNISGFIEKSKEKLSIQVNVNLNNEMMDNDKLDYVVKNVDISLCKMPNGDEFYHHHDCFKNTRKYIDKVQEPSLSRSLEVRSQEEDLEQFKFLVAKISIKYTDPSRKLMRPIIIVFTLTRTENETEDAPRNHEDPVSEPKQAIQN